MFSDPARVVGINNGLMARHICMPRHQQDEQPAGLRAETGVLPFGLAAVLEFLGGIGAGHVAPVHLIT